jgi:hypothetical protein
MDGWARAAALAVVGGTTLVGAVACVDRPQYGIQGRVRQRPCGRPIVEGEPVCEDLPVEAGIVVTDGAGVVQARTRTRADGRFGVALRQPGDYTVTVDTGDPKPRWPDCPVTEVSVRKPESVEIFCGSGMR